MAVNKDLIRNIIRKLVAIILGFIALYFFVLIIGDPGDDISTPHVIFGTLFLIASFVMWQFSSAGSYNEYNDAVKLIFDTDDLEIEAVFKAFENLDTALGKPWLGEIKLIQGKSMIFGPNTSGEFIYVAAFGDDRIQVASNNLTSSIIAPSGEEWRLNPEQTQLDGTDDIIRYRFANACLLPELVERINHFRDTETADTTPIGLDISSEIYMFYEEFKWTGQDFYLYDTHGNKKLKIESQLPCKTFDISQVEDGKNLFMLTKRLFHFLPQYDLYEQGSKIGRMKKKLVFHRDYFVADTPYGKLELKGMSAMFGANYQVFIAGNPIGTIAEKLNIDLENLVFNNFILTVNEPKFLPLMTAMAVMTVREKSRDRAKVVGDVVDIGD